jgi:hypothetical protein
MWDIRRNLRPEPMPPKRAVIQFLFSNLPNGKNRWWLIVDAGEVDLCHSDPGHDVDLYFATDLRTMTAIWTGDLALESALASGALEAQGPPQLRRRLKDWFGLSAFAPVQSMRGAPAVA